MLVPDLFEVSSEAFARVKLVHSNTFARRGLILVLPQHDADQSTTGARGEELTERYLMDTLQLFLKAYDAKRPEIMEVFNTVIKTQRSVQATFKHPVDNTFVNLPCAIDVVFPNKFKFVVKTVMVKPNFETFKNDIVIVI